MIRQMIVSSFKRIFKDNTSYVRYSEIHFMEPLAQVAETYLYTKKAEADNDDIEYYSNFRLSDYIELCDFMSLAAYFIGAASTTHVRATIESYIKSLNYRTNKWDGMVVRYVDKGERMVIEDSIEQVPIALLWIAYIYSEVRSALEEESAPRWQEAAKTLHEMLKERIGVTDAVLKEKHHLYKQTGEAIRLLAKCIIKELEDLKKIQEAEGQKSTKEKQSENSASAADAEQTEELKARIEALMTENEHLKAEVADLRDALKVYEETKDIKLHDKVRLELGLRLLKQAGASIDIHGNKARAARVLKTLTDLAPSTCSNYVTNQDLNTLTHREEVLLLNSELQALGTDIRL